MHARTALGGLDQHPEMALLGPESPTPKPPRCPVQPPSQADAQRPARPSNPHPRGRVTFRVPLGPPATTWPGPACGLHLDL